MNEVKYYLKKSLDHSTELIMLYIFSLFIAYVVYHLSRPDRDMMFVAGLVVAGVLGWAYKSGKDNGRKEV